MNNKDFAHLHVHNQYSLLDGYGDAKQWISRAKKMGFRYIALTNHGNVDGCLKWQRECDNQGMNSVLGAELYVCPDAKIKSKAIGHIVILVKNEAGWSELCKLITQSHLDGYYKRPRVDYNMILNCDMTGWVVMTACLGSFINLDGGIDVLREINNRTDTYFEIMPPGMPSQIDYHHKWLRSPELPKNLPLVATVDCHYLLPEDNKTQDLLIAIKRNYKWKDPDRWSLDFRDLYMQSADEIYKGFKAQGQFSTDEIKTAMKNTIKIARQCCQFRIEKKSPLLPIPPEYKKIHTDQPSQKHKDAFINQQFDDLVNTGLNNKDLMKNEIYLKRVDEETKIISSKNFELYFLIVKDLVDWSKKNNIMTGPGRGSVGGCLIAYLLGITQIDPIKYNLPFSRFISEDRIDLPDIDIDFEKEKRHLVIEYLKKTYGRYNTAAISTFGSLQPRGSIRDVGRVFEIPYPEIDRFAKSISYQGADKTTIENELKNPKSEASQFQSKYPEETKYIQRITDQIRNSGQHAAAVIVSEEDLRDGKRCALKLNKDNEPIANWDMEDSEYNGLVKIDVLGLNTLSILNYAKELINEGRDKNFFNYEEINFDDDSVFQIINEGRTGGLFQIQAWPTTNLCQEIEIESFEEISATVALVRPGATNSGMTKKFIKRKHGEKWKKKHPIYEELTADTYGILAYQEQVMQVISRIAGLSETQADKIRKVIGKKRNPKEFRKHKQDFIKGCNKTKNFSEQEAEEFWEGLQEWAGYGFNRAHSIEYATIAYWTAWLKCYHPKEFYCASLTYGDDEDDYHKSKQRLIDEILENGWQIIPPKVCLSDATKWTFDGDTFYTPFTEIKGFGESNAVKCVNSKQKKACRGLFDIKMTVQNQTKLEGILDDIQAWDDDVVVDDIDQYLEFNMLDSAKKQYPNLIELMGHDTNTGSVEPLKTLNINNWRNFFPSPLIKRKRWHMNEVVECELCDLSDECRCPIITSKGIHNVFFVAEAPGRDEDEWGESGKNLIGRAGQLLWDEVALYGYTRRDFHIANTNRCYPKRSKTPSKKQVDDCFPWTIRELAETECRLVLGIGNNTLYAFTGRDKGIMNLSGTTEWVEEFGLWVCWCIHPSAVLRKSSNHEHFEKGIKNFIRKFELLKG
jgi:DNA polymerase-3 subunit alpha